MNYSNPRTEATIENWPSGKHRVEARFSIETHPSRGQRAVRVTTGKPKLLTYCKQARIVDGDDGRTYILELSAYGHISVMQGDFKYSKETIYERDERYTSLLAMLK